mmetsp:Transcript_25827/g.63555  ORF Transcript_25827/g.63555 Transcript_25827/m.63555 type:complete len:202 (+) Transcript_25827:133-738(+)|eukprot:CAMPEP_0197574948 /NCGR_PEP_ID=MMETSP1326-20131121/518_1 /TAXON_ID=1155430 /ORGANISM="Genus nov. species nov., Strain RCC2288" /LENGTH=201 /DNA_ID=CAMNT_0043137619 /DNA_START=108 /DNA_END=713 /DNA_ORIENTATION=-
MTAVMSTFSLAAPVRVSAAGARGGAAAAGVARPAFMGRATGKAFLGDAFAGLSLNTPARKQAQRGVSICVAAAGSAGTSINQVGFATPPSTGAAPTWDAIVEVGGSQQFVSEGRYYECHSLKGVEPGTKIAFERVLATLKDDEPTFGMPYVKGARVEATVLENYLDKKKIVFKYRRKKHYKRKNGHRQPMTRFLVTKVVKP